MLLLQPAFGERHLVEGGTQRTAELRPVALFYGHKEGIHVHMDDLAEIRVTLRHRVWQSTTSSPAQFTEGARLQAMNADLGCLRYT